MYRAKKDGTTPDRQRALLPLITIEHIVRTIPFVIPLILTDFCPTGPVLMGWKHPWDH